MLPKKKEEVTRPPSDGPRLQFGASVQERSGAPSPVRESTSRRCPELSQPRSSSSRAAIQAKGDASQLCVRARAWLAVASRRALGLGQTCISSWSRNLWPQG